MKKNKKLVKTQRKSLDEKLKMFNSAKTLINPKGGWVRAIREAIGMTTVQLAERIGIQQSGVSLLEQREANKAITLETLQRAAEALNCKLIYGLVPKESLEKIVNEQAQRAAHQIIKSTLHSMELEQQETSEEITQLHQDELALELKDKLDRRLWGTK